ncbi:hypothetical protein [Clostridium perfringens]|uniref:Transposase n=1 Tax=Clostridium perfringens F262 TaxID=883064 RepID=A0AAV3FE00_CLOPF|nr:hypothetical protein [Clostridium perfringens]UWG09990.1 MAG: hypothetical protein [Bacteriophage sp.]EIA17555.1 hypothetical protein HA1_06232 [Clostridium perfringens F262]MDK0680546.1 hypothetical protein [Clostridium perfringens]MDK0856749.1 hypothetical protein [Clostridium perfringens]MDM0592823.1 hypothetical protein [Clostridium perfringens]
MDKFPRYKNEDLKEKTTLRKLAQEQLDLINTGSKTINQVRKVYGLEVVEGGYKLYHKIVA